MPRCSSTGSTLLRTVLLVGTTLIVNLSTAVAVVGKDTVTIMVMAQWMIRDKGINTPTTLLEDTITLNLHRTVWPLVLGPLAPLAVQLQGTERYILKPPERQTKLATTTLTLLKRIDMPMNRLSTISRTLNNTSMGDTWMIRMGDTTTMTRLLR